MRIWIVIVVALGFAWAQQVFIGASTTGLVLSSRQTGNLEFSIGAKHLAEDFGIQGNFNIEIANTFFRTNVEVFARSPEWNQIYAGLGGGIGYVVVPALPSSVDKWIAGLLGYELMLGSNWAISMEEVTRYYLDSKELTFSVRMGFDLYP